MGRMNVKINKKTGIAVSTLGGELAQSKVAASIARFADYLEENELRAIVIDATCVDLPDETDLSLEMWRDGLEMLPAAQQIAYIAPPRFHETREIAVRLAAGKAEHELEVFDALVAAMSWAGVD